MFHRTESSIIHQLIDSIPGTRAGMRKLGIASVVVFLLLTVTGNNSLQAQVYGPLDPGFRTGRQIQGIHRTIGTPVYSEGREGSMGMLEVCYPQVARKFSKLFPAATSQRWFREKKSLFVYFSMNGKKVTAVFTLSGSMNYAVMQLQPRDLPANVARRLRSSYSYYSVFNVKEITVGDEKTYVAILESTKEFKVLSISENDLKEISQVKKTL